MHIMDRMQCIDVPPITTHLTRTGSVLCRQAKVNDVHQIALFRNPYHEVVGCDAAMHNRLGMHILYAADLYAKAVHFHMSIIPVSVTAASSVHNKPKPGAQLQPTRRSDPHHTRQYNVQ